MRNRREILKGAGVLLVVAVMVLSASAVTANTKMAKNVSDVGKSVVVDRGVLFEDDFESYADFVLDFPPWTQFDGDGSATYGFTSYDFPNEYYTGSYIIFNPSQCTPPVPDAPPHSGDKYAACFNAVLPATNDDWLFTPQLSSTAFDELSFWARSYTDEYNLDRFEVGVSTTDTNPSSFTIISTSPYIEAPITWTEYTYDISGYSGDIYIGIHCVSYDAFFLMVDDFEVTEEEIPPVPDLCCNGSLSWDEVAPGSTVTGDFDVSNCGEDGSELNWEVKEWPNWGNWTFTPSSGTGLTPAMGWINVDVEVVAPDDPDTEFTGEVKVINSDDPSDYCIIPVYLKTPVNQNNMNMNMNALQLLQQLMQRLKMC